MKISHNWLKNYINIESIAVDTLAEMLTNCGLEVESVHKIESIKGGLEGLIVGEVIDKQKHIDADRLSVTKVKINEQELPLTIVCGASNVAIGQKVVVAPVGCTIYPINSESFKINKSKIRGQVSEGMLCAEDEIGIGESHNGIIELPTSTKIGTFVSDFYKVETDFVYEIGLTPNRVDASSHYGVARDLRAVLNHTFSKNYNLQLPSIEPFKEGTNQPIEITIEDTLSCLRYSAVVINNIKVTPSPAWLQQKLKSIGLSPINNIVDITNFVLHETGQPLHAFDADKLTGNKIIVKTVTDKTKFVTLDGVERTLSNEDLMICDAEKPLCIAGVFGGIDSGISENTTTIFLESAYFNPVSVRKTAKRHGLNTDASFRFERGTDPEMTIYALKRAALLMQEITEGNITSSITDIYPTKINPFKVDFYFENCHKIIGKKIDESIIKNIITSLEINIINQTNEKLALAVPTFKVDVTREIDVIEEILRIYGYNNVEVPSKMISSLTYKTTPDKEKIVNLLADLLANKGFTELLSNSLTKKSYYPNNQQNVVQLLNPLSSELEILRQTLLFNGLETIQFNQNRKNADLQLFEIGKVYHKETTGFRETNCLSILLTGNIVKENWNTAKERYNFYHLKGFVQAVLERVGLDTETLKAEELNNNQFSYGLSYSQKNKEIVKFGEVANSINQQFNIDNPVYFAEINVDVLLELINSNIIYKPIAKFPSVRRDLSMLLDVSVNYNELKQLAFQQNNKVLKSVNLFDVYEGKNLEKNKKSYAISFVFQDDEKTLTDTIVDDLMKEITTNFIKKFNVSLR